MSSVLYAPWTPDEVATLRAMWEAGEPVKVIARTLGRTENAVISKVHSQGLPQRRPHLGRRAKCSRPVQNAPTKSVGAWEVDEVAGVRTRVLVG